MKDTYTCENCGALESLSGCLSCSQCGVYSKCFETFDTLKAENATLRSDYKLMRDYIYNLVDRYDRGGTIPFVMMDDEALKGGSDERTM